jgi:predicted enzyme related to lactoylglutathione lyase
MASSLAGKFVWYELTTPDAAAARRFFAEVLGWTSRDGMVPGIDYSLTSIAGTDIAGVMGQQEGMPAAWLGYICTDDIQAAFAQATAAGAAPIVPVSPIPGIGRFSILIDPTGAPFGLLDYADAFPKPTVPDRGIQGHIWWRELHTTDRAKAFDFYSSQFGWQETERMPMGPEEFYQVFGDPLSRGGMLTDRDAAAPHWLFYVWVDDIDATIGKIGKAGGTVLNGPMEVPGGAWIVQAADPQGIVFALVGDRTKK